MNELINRVYRSAGDPITVPGGVRGGERREESDETMARLVAAIEQWRSSISQRLADLARQIEERAVRTDDWERLEHHVRDAFPEFHAHLAKCSPPLTPTETKVFLLIGMSISPADAAVLLRCTRRTILKHRSSIRRKLHLPDDETLIQSKNS